MCIEPGSLYPRSPENGSFVLYDSGSSLPIAGPKCCSWVSWGRHLHTEHHIGVLRAIASRQKSRGCLFYFSTRTWRLTKKLKRKHKSRGAQLPFECLEGFNSFRKSLRNCHFTPGAKPLFPKPHSLHPPGLWPFAPNQESWLIPHEAARESRLLNWKCSRFSGSSTQPTKLHQ